MGKGGIGGRGGERFNYLVGKGGRGMALLKRGGKKNVELMLLIEGGKAQNAFVGD